MLCESLKGTHREFERSSVFRIDYNLHSTGSSHSEAQPLKIHIQFHLSVFVELVPVNLDGISTNGAIWYLESRWATESPVVCTAVRIHRVTLWKKWTIHLRCFHLQCTIDVLMTQNWNAKFIFICITNQPVPGAEPLVNVSCVQRLQSAKSKKQFLQNTLNILIHICVQCF